MMNGSESSGWMDNPVAENIICSARKQKRAHVFNGLFLWRLVNSVQLFGVSTPRGSICMPRQHQISRLPVERQGEVSYC